MNEPEIRVETKEDLEALVRDEKAEGRTIDYKEALPDNADSDRKEFLADVSSFANAAGGHIIYGVTEKRDEAGQCTGKPEAVGGLQGVNPDAEIRRLDEMARSSIAPRIPSLRITHLPGFPKGPVIIVTIPKSWRAPHMVTYKGSSRFFSRVSKGKYQLNVDEIRDAFMIAESLPDRIRRFRDERVGRIVAGETPVFMEATSKIILHLVPSAALHASTVVDIKSFLAHKDVLGPIYSQGWTPLLNFDGLLTYAAEKRPWHSSSYLQIFRNGSIEAVEGSLIQRIEGAKRIPGAIFEDEVSKAVGRYVRLVRQMSFEPPVYVLLTLIGVQGYSIDPGTRVVVRPYERREVDRDSLFFPEVIIEDLEAEPARVMRHTFDMLWQAAGWPGSRNYDESGTWRRA